MRGEGAVIWGYCGIFPVCHCDPLGSPPGICGTYLQKAIMEEYDICEHSHRFAAWCAGRAASRGKHGFSVELARELLDASVCNDKVCTPDQLPAPAKMDEAHKHWRDQILKRAPEINLHLSHGIAAKLINVYLKARFVHPHYETDARVSALHPPIDRILLNSLARIDLNGKQRFWRRYANIGWTNFCSDQYEAVIYEIRDALGQDVPMWQIEAHWAGHQ